MNRLKTSGIALLIVVALLIAARAVLPYGVESFVNRKLDRMGSYHGSVADVDLHLWRGAYTLHDLAIIKTGGKVPIPLLTAPKTELSIGWRQLLKGELVGTAEFESPELNFVDSAARAGKQGGGGVNWRQKLQELLPITLDEVVVHDGTIAFKNLTSNPPVDLKATGVEATVRNLTNVVADGQTRAASFEGTANILEQAKLDAAAEFDPIGRPDSFSLRLRVLDVDLKRANSFVRAYSGLDVAKGRGDFVMEVEAKDGKVKGYAKPLLRELEVFSWERDVRGSPNPLRVAWQTVTAFAVNVFTNRRHDQFGTRVELSGTLDDREVDVPGALWGIVRNAFVEAYKPDFESLAKDAKPAKDKK